MILIGLTGSIGMGKSATANMFAELGIPVFDSDQAVHQLYDIGGEAVPLVEAEFPGVTQDGRVDRDLLSAKIKSNPTAWKRLESIVHPLVRKYRDASLREAADRGADMFVMDIPLLFESQSEESVDHIVVVTAPFDVQRMRVLERPGMTEEKFEEILAQQVPDQIKQEKADFVVDTSRGFDAAREQVKKIVDSLRADSDMG